MSDRVAIVAMAQTKFERKKSGQRFQEMVWEVVQQVREQTGLDFHKPGHIDNAVTCSDDFFDARTISDAPMGDLVGAHLGPEEKVSQDALQAVFYGMVGILSGHYDVTLVVAHGKESQVKSRNLITHAAFDPLFSRGVGLDYLSAAALQARAYLTKFGIRPEETAAAVVRDRRHAALNPKAQEQELVTVKEVLNSRPVCDPLRKLDIYPVSDGAVAMILAREDRAKELTDQPVWILGAGNCYDSYFLGDRNLADSHALRLAAARAYGMAGIKNPKKELDLAELSAHYSYQELLWLECLGLAENGHAGKWIAEGGTELHGEFPVNTSGGALAGNPLLVSGMARAAECFLQLRGEAEERQVKGVKRALAHGTTGPAGQHHGVMIFSNE